MIDETKKCSKCCSACHCTIPNKPNDNIGVAGASDYVCNQCDCKTQSTDTQHIQETN
jgi:hypothetical protein